MTKVIYDPPSGWRYGFPRAVPDDVLKGNRTTADWLIECGYPEDDVEFALRNMRVWNEN